MQRLSYILFSFLCLLLSACRGDIVIQPSEEELLGDSINGYLLGFYLLNEGNMGSNKATLDYYDFRTATYIRNIYSERNPSVPLSLGDVGNDLQIYGSRMYTVINVSNKIEVMTADSAKRLGQINIPNCRYLCFDGQYGYVTSYAGPVQVGKDHAQIGYVARFDTASLQIIDTCLVGYQPDGLCAANGKLYVANSGGYMIPQYESTISVIDLNTFKELSRIEVAPNLYRIKKDNYNQLWVSSRGNYLSHTSKLYCLNLSDDTVCDSINLPVSNFCIDGDSLYFFGSQLNTDTYQEQYVYAIVNVRTHELLTQHFLSDPTLLHKPYGIAVNPITKDIYITDAKDHVTPGTLYCISPNGEVRWQVRTGDIPAHLAFHIETPN